MLEVNVVLVTYNRKECLEKLLLSIMEQSYQVKNIMIFDNNSNDGTGAFLKQKGYVDTERINDDCWYISRCGEIIIHYYKNSINSGGAGGFSSVIRYALDCPCDYIWIMDDDVSPEKNCLEVLLNNMTPESQACIPNRTDQNFADIPWNSFDLKKICAPGLTSRRKTFVKQPLLEKSYKVYDMPFEGPLISYDVIKKIGVPDASYFIIGDDTDYAIRVTKVTNITFVTGAILHRQLAKKGDQAKVRFEYNWKGYYSIRNYILIMKKHGIGFGARHINALVNLVYWNVKTIIQRDRKGFFVVNKAIIDGILGKKGKTVSPGEF